MRFTFTLTDKGLLMRAARLLKDRAEGLKKAHGPAWAATEAGKVAKKEYDRLERDIRDLRVLAKRLERDAEASDSENSAKVSSPSAVQYPGPEATVLNTGDDVSFQPAGAWPFPTGAAKNAEQPLPDDGLHPGTALS